MDNFPLSKVISLEDFANSEIENLIRDIFKHEIKQFPIDFPNGVPDSKQWEIAMSVLALKKFGKINPDSTILGIGAGTELTCFYLSNLVKQVFVTDLYLNAGVWADVAPISMLVDPEIYAPFDYDNNRLVVQHMDGRKLNYPDNTFDGIYSSGSIEHFGSLDEIANASYEMGRVLKPGGILALATEFKINGPTNGDGWDNNTVIFSKEKIIKYIIEASGLELVDELNTNLTQKTLETKRNLASFLANTSGEFSWQNKIENYPNLVLVHEGYVFCSIHLALRKPATYPISNNSWAAPSEKTIQDIEKKKHKIISDFYNTTKNQNTKQTINNHNLSVNRLIDSINEFNNIRLIGDRKAEDIRITRKSNLMKFFVRTIYRIRNWGKVGDAESKINLEILSTIQEIIGKQENMRIQLQSIEDLIEENNYNRLKTKNNSN